MIEKIIDEILEAEKNAGKIMADAADKASEIELQAAQVSEKVSKEFAGLYKAEADKKKAAAEQRGKEEADRIMSDAEKNAERLLSDAEKNAKKAVEFILGSLT